MTFLNRWESFKTRKDAIVEANIRARRKTESSAMVLIQLHLDAFVRGLWVRYERYREELYARNKMLFLLKVNLVCFLRRRFKKGWDFETRLHRELRCAITFQTRVLNTLHKPHVKTHVFLHFLIDNDFRAGLIQKFLRTRDLITFIQIKFRNSIDIINAKANLL